MLPPALQVELWKEHILHTPDIITTNFGCTGQRTGSAALGVLQ